MRETSCVFFFEFIFPSLRTECDVLLPQICLFYFRFVFFLVFFFFLPRLSFPKMLICAITFMEWNVILNSSALYFRFNQMSEIFFSLLVKVSLSVRDETHMWKVEYGRKRNSNPYWQDEYPTAAIRRRV